jgi:hypothetical protein
VILKEKTPTQSIEVAKPAEVKSGFILADDEYSVDNSQPATIQSQPKA